MLDNEDTPFNRNQLQTGLKNRKPSNVSDAESEFEVRKQIKYGSRTMAAWAMFSDYTGNSTLHGVKYLGERKRHWSERAFWVIAFLISVFGCFFLILKIYTKWQQTPVIVSFAEKSTPVWKVPFPAVTICPETKAKTSFVNFTQNYHIVHAQNASLDEDLMLTDDARVRMEAISQICDAHLLMGKDLNSSISPRECVPLLKEMAVPFDEMLMFCRWRSTWSECNDIFTEIITEEGICYTFNVLDGRELFRTDVIDDDFYSLNHNSSSTKWTLEDGYETDEPDTYPRRVLGSGARAGLNIVLRLYEYDLDYICRGPVQGFKILLHTPGEIPRVSKQYFRVPLNQEVVVSVKPQMITTSSGLSDYAPERYLRFFKVYTQANCELECLANFTMNECQCVKFSMPRDKDTPICKQTDIKCYDEAENKLMLSDLKEGLETVNKDNLRGRTHCNCLPSCTSINYDAEISQADFDWKKVFMAYNNPLDEYPGAQLARLTIFFKDSQFITSKRSELYGPTEFLANCGGLLGLFMGFSILSLIEIIYYLTIRLACNLNMRRQRKNKIRSLSNAGLDQDQIPGIKIDYSMDEKKA